MSFVQSGAEAWPLEVYKVCTMNTSMYNGVVKCAQ